LVLKKIDFSNGELSANAVIATLTSSGLPAIEHKHDPLIGAQWTLAASAATVLIHLLMRWVDLHPFLVVFWRNATCLALILPAVIATRAWQAGRPALSRHALRGIVNTGAMITLVMGLNRIPFAEVTALTFASAPFTLFGSIIFLREHPGPVRWLSALLGLIGVIIISPPGAGWLGSGGMLVLTSAALFAAANLVGKAQVQVASNLSILFYLFAALTFFSAPLAASVWQWPGGEALLLIGSMALIAIFAHYAFIAALRWADVSFLALFDYLRLIWGALVGIFVFGEALELSLILGGVLIIVAAIIPFAARN